MLNKYKALNQSFLYVESPKYPYTNVRLYLNKNGMCDVFVVDGFNKFSEIKYGLRLDQAKSLFKTWSKTYIGE